MDELFRFVVLRAPKQEKNVDVVAPSSALAALVKAEGTLAAAARTFRESTQFVTSADQLTFGGEASKLRPHLGDPVSATKARELVHAAFGKQPAEVATTATFKKDFDRLGDSIVAIKLLSSCGGVDGDELVALRQTYDFVGRAAQASDRVGLRPVGVSSDLLRRPKQAPRLAKRDVALSKPAAAVADLHVAHAQLLGPQALTAVAAPGLALPTARRPIAASDAPELHVSGASVRWVASPAMVEALPDDVKTELEARGYPLDSVPIQAAVDIVNDLRRRQAAVDVASERVVRLGNRYYESGVIGKGGVVGAGAYPLTPPSSVRPVGIGDLLIVREHTKAYQGGEVAHIENVLRSEQLVRETRYEEKTSDTLYQETDTTQQQERDTQTTDRFSLNRETNDTVKNDSSLQAGVHGTYRYGTMVEVNANVDYQTSTSSENATQQATSYAQDVVTRASTTLTQKVVQARTTTTATLWEEKNRHGFDNAAGADNISGVYQWVDKIVTAQVFNYGKRLLFDVIVPEPSAFYVYAQKDSQAEGQTLTKPAAFTITPSDLDESNYQVYAQLYGATGIDPPPVEYKTIAKQWDFTGQSEALWSKSDSVTLDDDYEAVSYSWMGGWWVGQSGSFQLLVGNTYVDVIAKDMPPALPGEQGELSIGILFYGLAFALAVEVLERRTERGFQKWQESAYAAIYQAYQQMESDYERGLADAQAGSTVQISGNDPGTNAEFVAAELRKAAIALLTGQQYDMFGALETSSENFPELDLASAGAQGAYIRFFEQAFEWDQIMYTFYPYFWSEKDRWLDRALITDTDPAFADFLRAGAARVVFPVRPGFELAVLHYLETGELWNGGPVPDVTSELYVPIAAEISENLQAPQAEVPASDPWETIVPTTLVRLRHDDQLPSWHPDDGGVWVEDTPG